MKTLYLHIGTPKTATSSIQAFLRANTTLLAKQSCSFPIFFHKYRHVKKVRNARFLFLSEKSVVSHDPLEPSKEWKDRVNEYLGIIEKEFETNESVILTDENLWWTIFYAPASFLQILPQFAEKHGYHFKVIVYLRRQDSFMESLYKSKVKGAKTSLTMRTWYEEHMKKFPEYLDYDVTLKKISDVIGKENVIVRRFDSSYWKKNSICLDFLDAIGLDTSLHYRNLNQVVNPGLKGNMVELQRLVNDMDNFSKEDKYQFAEFTKQLSDEQEDDIPYYVFTSEETADFLKQFEEGNENVARTYIKDGNGLFNDEVKEVPIWSCNNEKMTTDVIRFFTAVTNDLYQKNKEQENKIAALEKEVTRLDNSRISRRVKRRIKRILRPDQ